MFFLHTLQLFLPVCFSPFLFRYENIFVQDLGSGQSVNGVLWYSWCIRNLWNTRIRLKLARHYECYILLVIGLDTCAVNFEKAYISEVWSE